MIHIIGIGGIGASGLAKIFHYEGKKVQGSDLIKTELTEKLKTSGIKIFYDQKPENIKKDIDLVIYSQAITEENPEYKKAKEYGIPCISYPQALGLLTKEKRTIAISGTHGKTTTSALIVNLLNSGGIETNFVIGGEITGLGNSGIGKSDFLVVEACEYKRSFLDYEPEIEVMTAIEEDHLDYYKDINDIVSAFKEFSGKIKNKGILIANTDDENVRSVISEYNGELLTYGIKNGHIRADNIILSEKGNTFDCLYNNKKIGTFRTNLYGLHNVLNSLACISAGITLKISLESIADSLEKFPGVNRRFQEIKNVNGITIMDDYGHHPTEIEATLKGLRQKYPQKRMLIIFQPHQYSRTRFLLKDFASSFSLADEVIVPDIYFVRDSEIEKKFINSKILVHEILKNGIQAKYIPKFSEIVKYLSREAKNGDLILTIGAGPINEVAYAFKDEIKNKYPACT
ncbi:MAG: UDP-N-acetylmuramate--L-alanine ligase [Candidatus Omnitrophica bacterium]|nr:UDP-N-acetylmuramate--L-alanine ligase [Candidatus Omnitrophota bacterium]